MTRAMPQVSIELRPWDDSDWPIAWQWLDASWDALADDFSPRDIDSFVAIKQQQGAVNVGVWREGDLCGLLILVPVSPVLAQGHCVFRRHGLRPDETVEVLRMAQSKAWSWGFRKLWCQVFEQNQAMRRVLRVLGAMYEGESVAHTLKDGQMVGMHNYALLRP